MAVSGTAKFDGKRVSRLLESYARVWNTVEDAGDRDYAVTEVVRRRGYFDSQMPETLLRAGLNWVPSDVWNKILAEGNEGLGLHSERGNPLMDGRFLLPIRDFAGNVVSIVGWLDDEKKYITASSEIFSKSTMYYGMETIPAGARSGNGFFLCEGIFDRLSLVNQGVSALSTMGADVSASKRTLYNILGRVVAIPDTDSVGSKTLRDDSWRLLSGSSYLRWRGGLKVEEKTLKIKDIDDFCVFLPRDYIQDALDYSMKSKYKSIVTLDLC